MAYGAGLKKFGRADFLPEGWFWLLRSQDVALGKAAPARFWNRDFVVYRGHDGLVRILDAHCPHMGAHLCDGSVEGNDIRCPFHFWKFNEYGRCIEIPAQSDCKFVAGPKRYRSFEAYGLIWIWSGDQTADVSETPPVIPELDGLPLDVAHGKPFIKKCHPNIMMINAIDAQHFRSVHNLVVDLDMKAKALSPRCIQFSNVTPMPKKNAFLRWAARFYEKALTYEMTYWWGHNGSVMVGPDFLHFYIIFALRPNAEGHAEGQTLLVTPRRSGLASTFLNPILLFLTKLVGNYFATGDTLIFDRIKFSFDTPIRADRAIVDFIEHYEKLKAATFAFSEPSRTTIKEPVIQEAQI
jgi:phenylpropionate dioxygenase-like ring-hydroxylating dioxygenase large terminal subunit